MADPMWCKFCKKRVEERHEGPHFTAVHVEATDCRYTKLGETDVTFDLDKVPYSDALDGDEQITAEEEVAGYIFDELHIDCDALSEDVAAEMGRNIVYKVLRRFRPDLFVDAPCKRCGTPLDDKGFCKDETCPHHDQPQDRTFDGP